MYFERSCSFLIHLGGNCFRAQRQQLFIFQFLPVSAGQSIGHDGAAYLRDIAFELA